MPLTSATGAAQSFVAAAVRWRARTLLLDDHTQNAPLEPSSTSAVFEPAPSVWLDATVTALVPAAPSAFMPSASISEALAYETSAPPFCCEMRPMGSEL